MIIEQGDIARFKELYLSKFGITLSNDEARVELEKLVLQFEMIYRPIRRDPNYLNVNENLIHVDPPPAPHS